MTNPNLRNAVHAGDFAAYEKDVTGQWMIDTVNGEIISRKTGKPIKFRPGNSGYLSINSSYNGKHIDIAKHRAVWVIARGIPLDFYAEVDHINGNKEDCRLENLRLLTRKENASHKFSEDVDEQIRRAYSDGGTQKELGRKYNCSIPTVHRIITNKTYKNSQKNEL